MDYEKLKSEIQEISNIAQNVPEQFRDKCFEILLKNLLEPVKDTGTKGSADKTTEAEKDNTEESKKKDNAEGIPINAQLRVFMRKYNITEPQLNSIAHYEDGKVFFIEEPKNTAVTKGQIEWALLLAFKNAILSKDFIVDPEDLRSICQEKGYYDAPNFAATLKRNSNMFKEALVPQGKASSLSDEGYTALSDLIKKLLT
jgi:hypothetical protein